MSKIHVLVPNQELADYALQIIAEEKIDACSVQVIHTNAAVRSAREAIQDSANVIVARGLQADLIREYTKIPLVYISMTGQEVGLLVEEAKRLVKKDNPVIALIGHYTMFPDSSYMNEIFHVRLRFYTYEDRSRSTRRRREDIPGMVQNYFKQYNKKYAKRVSLTRGGMEELCNARWDGNALQLERFCERLVLTAQKRNMDEVWIRSLLRELYPKIETHGGVKSVVIYEPPEKEEIEQALVRSGGSRQKTAELLGISTATLWRKMKKYGIE